MFQNPLLLMSKTHFDPSPIHIQSGQNRLYNFDNIFLTKVLFEKYLKEKC